MLKQANPETRLIVVGAGNFSRYEKTTRNLSDIHFRSHVSQEDLPRYYRSAHVFCAPNTGNESQGYVIMEALAAGRPVVASNIEGFAGVITNEVDGLLVRPRDHSAIADGIVRLIGDPGLRESLARHGQVRAEQFSWDTVAHRVMSYYERLLYERRQVDEARERTRA
jgi:phosphatidylinositol alpha-mannosyltransferase